MSDETTGGGSGAEPPTGGARLDLSDPAVRAMAACNHTPSEHWTLSRKLIGVWCETCCHIWPCPTIEALREYDDVRPERTGDWSH